MKARAASEEPVVVMLDGGLIAVMRLVLASAVLFIIVPLSLDELGAFHYLAACYVFYSLLIYLYTRQQVQQRILQLSYWADLAWAALLMVFSDDSITAFLFLFPILIAALHGRFKSALRFTIVAAAVLVAVTFHLSFYDTFSLAELELPPIFLLVFGYLVASWGKRELAAQQRLLLLKEATRLANPRFGTDRMIGTMMQRLCTHYDAEACLMVIGDVSTKEYLLRRTDRRDPEVANHAEPIPQETAALLMSLPAQQALLYSGTSMSKTWWSLNSPRYVSFDIRTWQRVVPPPPLNDALIALLDAESFVSIPLQYPDISIGRLYLTAARHRAFSVADVSFLLQIVDQLVPLIENIRLVDQLASSAADEERRRLARNIHDNVLQPYIGFQIGLKAVSRKLQSGQGDVASDVAALLAMSEHEIDVLRQYIRGLPNAATHDNTLLVAIQRFVSTFSKATHLQIAVVAPPNLAINDRLAAEVFQMVVEGLNNIRRHTQATEVQITLGQQDDRLSVQIRNDDALGVVPNAFVPRSISQRVNALGGRVQVEPLVAGGVQLLISISL